ncbi:MAG: cytochrome P450 [Mycobacterium sp.]
MPSDADLDPAELLPHYDMFDADHEQVKWKLFEYARANCPVFHTDADGKGQYVVTRYQDVKRVLMDPKTFSSVGVAPRTSPVCLNPLDVDPPFQIELRKLLNPFFTRGHLLRFEAELRKTAADLVDAFRGTGRCEFVRDFATPFVARAMATVVFNEGDRDKMEAIAEVVIANAMEPNDESYLRLSELAQLYLGDRQQHPTDRNDLLTAITTGTVAGGRLLTEVERLGVITVLFLGGLDTTRGAMGFIAHALAVEPDLETRLRNPAWIRHDMDELIRLGSSVGCLGRRATTDVELGGVQISAGDHVLLRFDSANRDETQFDEAATPRFDIRRGGNVGFGLGVHRCLGAQFARLQLEIVFDELLARLTRVRLACDPDEIRWTPGIANGPEVLPLTFESLTC